MVSSPLSIFLPRRPSSAQSSSPPLDLPTPSLPPLPSTLRHAIACQRQGIPPDPSRYTSIHLDIPSKLYASGDTITGKVIFSLPSSSLSFPEFSPPKALLHVALGSWKEGEESLDSYDLLLSLQSPLSSSSSQPILCIPSGEHVYSFSFLLPHLTPSGSSSSSSSSSFSSAPLPSTLSFPHHHVICIISLDLPFLPSPSSPSLDQLDTFTYIRLRERDIYYDLHRYRQPQEIETSKRISRGGVWAHMVLSAEKSSGHISVRLSLPRTGYTMGEVIPISLSIHHHRQVHLPEAIIIQLRLYEFIDPSIRTRPYSSSLIRWSFPLHISSSSSSDPSIYRTIFSHELRIPEHLPPSQKRTSFGSIHFSYGLRATVYANKTRTTANRVSVRLPIYLGTATRPRPSPSTLPSRSPFPPPPVWRRVSTSESLDSHGGESLPQYTAPPPSYRHATTTTTTSASPLPVSSHLIVDQSLSDDHDNDSPNPSCTPLDPMSPPSSSSS
ncbi:MAG: hypothetical protein DHS80DRAFT_31633 [Piptocephalis tieghemiana]|nr:MAG: hypothetical protein DHS80DRAFT_31633 [Piptocephalis tieghemiana]